METAELVDRVGGPAPADLEARRDAYWRFLERLHLGLIHVRENTIYALGIPLIRLGRPWFEGQAWLWRVEGGLLTARPGGELGFGAENGHLVAFLRGYHPTLPEPLYSVTQRPFHHFVTRLFLLHLRGRRLPPGVPAEPAARVASAAIDAAVVWAGSRLLPRRFRPVAAAAYFAIGWSLTGRTLGERALGLRVVSVDGSAVTPGQALLRLLAAPAALVARRAVHDELTGTEVIRES
jgi:RDD family protein